MYPQGIDPAEIIATFHALRASAILASSGFCDGGAVNEGTFRITPRPGTQRDDHVKVAILVGSLLAASVARLLLRSRNRIDDRVLNREHRRARVRESFSAPDVRLAVALFGADTVRHEHAGVRDAYELLKAESERFVG